jgi:phage terminase large subunit-like protein
MFPATGPYRRELYRKQLDFFAAGAVERERILLGGNRSGKTEAGAYETALHLTGLYPDWWQGRRFTGATTGYAAGTTSAKTTEIIQTKLLGPISALGTGTLPAHTLIRSIRKSGVPDAFEAIFVRHVSGGQSMLIFKSFTEGRASFEGTSKHFAWLDEECPEDVYSECLTRTQATGSDFAGGIVYLTFTPLKGITPLVKQFLPDGTPDGQRNEGKHVTFVSQDDVPHLTEADKEEMYKRWAPHERDARRRGVPTLGAGAIYPIPETDIVVPDFAIPDHWPRCYGLDVGWNRTAAVWGALDREAQTLYLYAEHYRSEAGVAEHASAIKARGEWIPGVIDPASFGRGQADGQQLMELYRRQGLKLTAADNAVEAGLLDVLTMMQAGSLKVFNSLGNWRSEFRLYRRDEKGRVVKEYDHLMDATRYRVRAPYGVAICRPGPAAPVVRPRIANPGSMV